MVTIHWYSKSLFCFVLSRESMCIEHALRLLSDRTVFWSMCANLFEWPGQGRSILNRDPVTANFSLFHKFLIEDMVTIHWYSKILFCFVLSRERMCIEHALRLLSDRTVYIIIYVTIAFWLAERSWLDSQLSQVHPNLFPGFLFFPFLRAEEREGNEVDFYQFAGQIILTISNMITISNLSLEDRKKEFYFLKGTRQTSFLPIEISGSFMRACTHFHLETPSYDNKCPWIANLVLKLNDCL